jgi:hypothetical protein
VSLPRTLAAALAMAALALPGPAQITVLNSASGVANPFVACVGSQITIDSMNAIVGSACADRVATGASTSFIPTGVAINPNVGFTIQFWLRASTGPGATLDYLFGDSSMLSPTGSGAFRCFFNGVAGAGAIAVRGMPGDMFSVGAPILANTWIHIAVTYNPATMQSQLFVNGALNNAVTQTGFTWTTGSNLSICGYSNSTAALQGIKMDDIRIYGFARSAADIAADYTMAASGTGPSGMANLPNRAYFNLEGSVFPHYLRIGTNADPITTGTRVFTDTTLIEWDGDSPAGDLPASCLMNILGPSTGHPPVDPITANYRNPPSMPVSYTTPIVAGLELGHGLSIPSNTLTSILWPDGLSLSTAIPGLVAFGLVFPYSYVSTPPNTFVIPPGIFMHGDAIHMQMLAPDPAYPLGIAVTNRATFVYTNCNAASPGAHVRVEARGTGAIQVQGFWEIHNTGFFDITQVTIDTTTCLANGGTATGFNTTGALNTGGTLASGTSYRFGSNNYVGLMNLPAGFTAIPAGSTTPTGLQFAFTSFTGCTDALIFDCDSLPTGNMNGNAYIGATITVNFFGGAVLSGLMVADPGDPTAAVFNM